MWESELMRMITLSFVHNKMFQQLGIWGCEWLPASDFPLLTALSLDM